MATRSEAEAVARVAAGRPAMRVERGRLPPEDRALSVDILDSNRDQLAGGDGAAGPKFEVDQRPTQQDRHWWVQPQTLVGSLPEEAQISHPPVLLRVGVEPAT